MNNILKTHAVLDIDFRLGRGCYLYDAAGKSYLDLESGSWALALGHSHPEVLQTLHSQSSALSHLGVPFPHQTTVDAASLLLDLLNMADGKCTFLSSGSEAVDLALALARKASGKQKCLVFRSTYLSANAKTVERPDSDWVCVDWNELESDEGCDRLQGIPFEDIGVFAFEAGGSGTEAVRFPSVELIQSIVRKTRQAGGMVVANEITCGFGRLGTWFGFEHYGIEPDIVALGKCLGNGYPVSAVVVGRDLAEKIELEGYHHAQSHQNDPLGCAVVCTVLKTLLEQDWIRKSNEVGTYFLDRLKRLEKYAAVKQARGRGMLFALEIYPDAALSVSEIYQSLLDKGFIVAGAASRYFLRMDPPLVIEKSDIDAFVSALESILSAE